MRLWRFFLTAALLMGCSAAQVSRNTATVSLVLDIENAGAVSFACSLEQYILRPAERIDADTWRVQVPSAQSFTYFYVVDGDVYVPECRFKESDDFGAANCVFVPEM